MVAVRGANRESSSNYFSFVRLCNLNLLLLISFRSPPYNPLLASVAVSLAFALAVNQLLIYGSISLSSGISTGSNALNFLSNTFVDLTNYGSSLTNNGNVVVSDFAAAKTAKCSTEPLIDAMNAYYFPNVDLYYSQVSPISDDCDTGSNLLSYYGTDIKNDVIWVLYILLTIGVLLYSVGLYFQSKRVLEISFPVVEILMIIFIAVCTAEMIGLVS